MNLKSFIRIGIGIFLLLAQTANAQDHKQFQLQKNIIVDQLNHPWAMEWLDDNNILISERNGDLVLFDIKTNQKSSIKVPALVYRSGQGGLLDIKKHPDFNNNHFVYLTFSLRKEKNQNLSTTALARFKLQNKNLTNFEILFKAQPWQNSGRHFGSRITFDQANQIYFSVGDRGNRKSAQDLTTDLGKIICLQDNGDFTSNPPFPKNPAVFSYGHRNPQGLLYYQGIIYQHEHGPRGGDELNIIDSGKNYGWPTISYGKEYLSNRQVGEGVSKKGMEQPLHYWIPSIAPSGMDILIQKNHPWHENLVVGSLKFGYLVRLKIKNNKAIFVDQILTEHLGRIREINIKDGIIYILTDKRNGELIKFNFNNI